MKKTWTTENGDEIEYTKLEDSHLLNILKFIKRRAEEGVTEVIDFGYVGDDDFQSGDVDTLYGDDVLRKFDYQGLEDEAKKRGLLTN